MYNIIYIYLGLIRYIPQIYHFTSDVFFTFVGQNPHKKVRIQRLLRCVCQLLRVPSLLVLLWNGEDITKKSDEFPWDLGSSWGNWHAQQKLWVDSTNTMDKSFVVRFSQIDYHEILWFHQLTGVFPSLCCTTRPKGISLINPQESVCYPLVVLSPAGCTPVLVYIYGDQSLSVPWSSHWTCLLA